jgi:hypothetical protein
MPAALVAIGLSIASPVVVAQYDEDEQTRDHEDVDRSYIERYRQERAEPEDESGADDVAAVLARAERLIRDRNYRSASSEHYRVQTDDPRVDARAAVALLDAFRTHFDDFWRDRMDLAPYDEQSRVFLFYSFHEFNQAVEGDFRYRRYRPVGHYGAPFDVITLHTDAEGPGALGEALIHEAAHQLTDQRLFPGEQEPSRWVSEGLANYFGYTWADEAGRFQRGELGGKSTELIRGARSGGAEIRGTLRSARAALKSAGADAGELVADVISIRDPSRFYGDGAPLNYGVSWLLVHFLLDGEDGARADGFVRYLESEKRGRGGSEALYREIDLGPDELGSALLNHAKRLKVR